MTPSGNSYIVFLPWVGIRQEISVGPFTLWPYYSLSRQKISDTSQLTFLDDYFRSFVDQNDAPVDTVVVCSFQNSALQAIDDQHYQKIRRMVDSLIFSQISIQMKWSVLRSNRSMGPPAADLFELIADTYYSNKREVAFYSGSILHTGWEIGKITFRKPWYVGSPICLENEDLLTGLGTLAESNSAQRNRIFSSLEWYRLAHTDVDQISPFSKIVMMITAFEILLRIPKNWKRITFANKVEESIATSDMPKSDWFNPQTQQIEPKTQAFFWAYKFYKLRNNIVHDGNTSIEVLKFDTPHMNWLTQLIVADLVFSEVLMRKLFQTGLFGSKVRETIEAWEPTDAERPGITESVFDMFYDFGKIHQILGWAPCAGITTDSVD